MRHSLNTAHWGSKIDVEELAQHLLSTARTLTDQHAPVRKLREPACPKPRPQPWIDTELKRLLQLRTTLHRKLHRHPDNAQLKQQYRAIRRQGKLRDRKLKSEFLIKKSTELRNNRREQRALLNALSASRSDSHRKHQ